MSVIEPQDLDYKENIYALILAILYPIPLRAEQAFEKLAHPDKRVNPKGSDVAMLRHAGCSWREIKALTGCKWPQSTYINHMKQKRKRENNVTGKKNEKAKPSEAEGCSGQGGKGHNP
jgi:hypothetical protein